MLLGIMLVHNMLYGMIWSGGRRGREGGGGREEGEREKGKEGGKGEECSVLAGILQESVQDCPIHFSGYDYKF